MKGFIPCILTIFLLTGCAEQEGIQSGRLQKVATMSPRGWDCYEFNHDTVKHGLKQTCRMLWCGGDNLATLWCERNFEER